MLVSFAVILSSCDAPANIATSIIESEYNFDPAAIQQLILAGHPNFQLIQERELGVSTSVPKSTPLPNYHPVIWSEAAFESVVQASIDFLGKRSVGDSRLFTIWFQTPCQYADVGPQQMVFGYFEVMSPKESGGDPYFRYFKRWATIDTKAGQLTWREDKLSHIDYEEQNLDRSGSYISAEVALHIAEVAGGAAFRARFDNACEVMGSVTAGIAHNEWRVEYMSNKRPTSILNIQVDRDTKEGKIFATLEP